MLGPEMRRVRQAVRHGPEAQGAHERPHRGQALLLPGLFRGLQLLQLTLPPQKGKLSIAFCLNMIICQLGNSNISADETSHCETFIEQEELTS